MGSKRRMHNVNQILSDILDYCFGLVFGRIDYGFNSSNNCLKRESWPV
jgi:hypothetical protein